MMTAGVPPALKIAGILPAFPLCGLEVRVHQCGPEARAHLLKLMYARDCGDTSWQEFKIIRFIPPNY